MSNQFPINCNRCGALLDPNQLAGLCPRCLAAQHFATDTAASDALASRHEPPPSLENIAASFPQLEAIEFLGRGGMGVVYRARQKSLGRTVALKLLAPERLGDPDFATRFEREAKALAALNHPNIVTVYDFGKADQFYYLLMEFVDGVNLRQAMSAGRFTPEQSLAIVPPVCEALQYAHEHGIVHRDIKPENLLLDKEGRVKIADFGIAKMLGTETSIADISELQPVGTPQYMAPEQKLHLKTDHRADIYSLGVVLYEMLTGELPTGQLQPPSRRIQIDVRIDQIVLKALEASPEMRFGTAAEFRSNVEAVTRQGAVSPTAPKASLPVSALALWGAAWAAMCLLSPSWPFIVVGLGLLTLLLVVLFDFLVVRAVWRRLNRSQTAEGGAANSWTWSIVVGGLLALVGGAILLGRPVINELVDDFGLTKSARAHHQTHERASQNWSDLTTAAAEAMIALEAAKKVEDAAEVERLTRESQLLREGATQAERALNQVALQKHASERERSNLLYLLGGGLIATGLLICFQDASRSRRPIAQHAVSSHLSGTATLMTPAELASIWNQFFCYRTRGPLMLDGDTLTHCYAGRTTSIPLQTIRDVSIGRLPRLMNLAGLSVLSITYEDDGEPRQVLISPIEGGYEFSQAAVSDWCASIRQAVVGATGRKPTTTPPEQLGIPWTSKMMTKYK